MAPLLSTPDTHRLRLRLLTATALGLSLGINSQASANPFGSAPVSDRELGGMRGGYQLPNGMNVTVGVQIETYVDGTLALRTVLNVVDTAKAALEVFVPAVSTSGLPDHAVTVANTNPTVVAALSTSPGGEAAPSTSVAAAPDALSPTAAPVVSIAAADSGTAPVVSSPVMSAPVVSLGETAGTPGATGPALVQNLAVQSDLGSVTIEQTKSGSVVILKGPDLEIQHMTGNSTGVLIANTLDNRAIDTVATVNISLSDSAVPVGNIMLRIDSIVLDAVGGGVY